MKMSFKNYCLVASMIIVCDLCSQHANAARRHFAQRTVTVSRSVDHVPASRNMAAQQKAELMAARSFCGHVGGSFGTGTHEGCGMAGDRESAIRNCCFWGQRQPIEIGVAQGRNGLWYACVFYR